MTEQNGTSLATEQLMAGKRPFHFFPLSAPSHAALQAQAAQWAQTLINAPEQSLMQMGAEACAKLQPQNHRAVVWANSIDELYTRLLAVAAGEDVTGVWVGIVTTIPRVAFLFTGHGAQYAHMGRQLYETEPVFRQALDQCDALLRPYLSQSLLTMLYPEHTRADDDPDPLLDGMTYSQPAIFAVEYALARLWQSWGIQPAAVMGHSVGEYVAACVAGVFDLADGLHLVAARGRLMDSLPASGQMMAVFADEAHTAAAIAPYREQVSIAVINGPTNIVISGDSEAIAAVVAILKQQHIKVRLLAVAQASHSPLLEPILDAFTETAAVIRYAQPHTAYVSCATAEWVTGTEVTTADYWRQHLRGTVRFSQAMETLHAADYRLFLETGPAPVLLRMGKRCLPKDGQVWLPSLDPKEDAWTTIAASLAYLFTAGVEVDWSRFYPDE